MRGWNVYLFAYICVSILIVQKMNYSLSLKRPRHPLTLSNTDLSISRPYLNLWNPPSSKTLPITPHSEDKQSKMKTTDYKIFLEKQEGSEESLPSCFSLIVLPTPNPFVTIPELNKLEFCALAHPIKNLVGYSKTIIEANPQRRAIGKSFNLLRLIELIAEHYNITAYHNFTHAFSVLQLLYQSYNRSDALRNCLNEKQWFYAFVAALAHDLKHPGTTNAFEVKSKSALAMEAGNESVLEKMHLSSLWGILKKNSQVNFLQGYSSHEASDIRKLITRLVMATDVTKHFKGLEGLKQFSKAKRALEGQNAVFIVEQLFHACDIGNPCLDFGNYMNWAALVSYEFDQIARKEKELGLEVTAYLKYDNLHKYYGSQLSFCSGLVLPLWREISLVLPGLEEMRENIERNMVELERRREG